MFKLLINDLPQDETTKIMLRYKFKKSEIDNINDYIKSGHIENIEEVSCLFESDISFNEFKNLFTVDKNSEIKEILPKSSAKLSSILKNINKKHIISNDDKIYNIDIDISGNKSEVSVSAPVENKSHYKKMLVENEQNHQKIILLNLETINCLNSKLETVENENKIITKKLVEFEKKNSALETLNDEYVKSNSILNEECTNLTTAVINLQKLIKDLQKQNTIYVDHNNVLTKEKIKLQEINDEYLKTKDIDNEYVNINYPQ